jgi:hypothetical protein
MIDVAACVTYHIARNANMNIASCDTMVKTASTTTPDERLRH